MYYYYIYYIYIQNTTVYKIIINIQHSNAKAQISRKPEHNNILSRKPEHNVPAFQESAPAHSNAQIPRNRQHIMLVINTRTCTFTKQFWIRKASFFKRDVLNTQLLPSAPPSLGRVSSTKHPVKPPVTNTVFQKCSPATVQEKIFIFRPLTHIYQQNGVHCGANMIKLTSMFYSNSLE